MWQGRSETRSRRSAANVRTTPNENSQMPKKVLKKLPQNTLKNTLKTDAAR